MRYSQQREAIRDIICGTRLHPTADWVYNKAKKIIPNISLGTVYRNLKRLEEEGEINTIYDGNIVRYD
ncbi:MAG TPA: transcriptional repressor, partial [Candidatus Marinimicrobia bacterium]|nr:transcriptional repressor [Candidatus Neomarinimicrobiota bacterium]